MRRRRPEVSTPKVTRAAVRHLVSRIVARTTGRNRTGVAFTSEFDELLDLLGTEARVNAYVLRTPEACGELLERARVGEYVDRIMAGAR